MSFELSAKRNCRAFAQRVTFRVIWNPIAIGCKSQNPSGFAFFVSPGLEKRAWGFSLSGVCPEAEGLRRSLQDYKAEKRAGSSHRELLPPTGQRVPFRLSWKCKSPLRSRAVAFLFDSRLLSKLEGSLQTKKAKAFALAFCASTVPGRGLEPLRLTAHAPQTCLSTSSNTRAGCFNCCPVLVYHPDNHRDQHPGKPKTDKFAVLRRQN